MSISDWKLCCVLCACHIIRTKDSLASGNYLSVVNILMQLRKVGPITLHKSTEYYLELVFQ